MKIFSFNEDSDRLVVVKKSEGEMTVVIKMKNADKESEKKMNFTPKRLAYLYKLYTRDFSCTYHSRISSLYFKRYTPFFRKE